MFAPAVGRRHFLKKLMLNAGLSYEQSLRAYRCLMSVIEDGVINSERVVLGHVGSLRPVRKPPRDISMGFERVNGEVIKTTRIFHLDERVVYQFYLHNEFVHKHQLNGLVGRTRRLTR